MAAQTNDDINERLLLAAKKSYEGCMSRLSCNVHNGLTLDFHYIRFDNNGNRKEESVVEMLVNHIVAYSLNEKDIRKSAHPVNSATHDAMRLFAQRGDSGESGELLLYILIELFLGAPQVLAKMSLKTNPHIEYNGADGVHVKYNGPSQPLDIMLGESKIWKKAAAAIDDALESIAKIRLGGIKHEILLATNHFKWLDADAREKILELLDPDSPTQNYRVKFVALVGFELAPHGARVTAETQRDFLAKYTRRAAKISQMALEKMAARESEFGERCDDVIHIFFVPFSDVEAFRLDFVKYLTTGRFGK